jgi:VWFA-related protein
LRDVWCLLLPAVFLLQAQEATFSAGVRVVNVLATVRDKQRQIIRDLTKDDFLLEEDGRPQTIRYFSPRADLPLTLGLLVDTSGSQRRVLGEQRQASHRFLNQVLREGQDQAFVMQFDNGVELLEELTSSREDLANALALLVTPPPVPRHWQAHQPAPRGGRSSRGTSLYDAVLLASDDVMREQAGRKALILLSDGVDAGSKVSLEDAIASAQRADTLVYSIRFYDEQAYGKKHLPDGKKTLERLAKETGGGYFEVSSKQPLERVFERMEEELRNQYSLGYTPDRQAGGAFRRIRLTTKQKGLLVQSTDGYYPHGTLSTAPAP